MIQKYKKLSHFVSCASRTKSILSKNRINFKNIIEVCPMTYLEFNYLVKNSSCVITDSGGITEETTVMNIPCTTLRNNTERPETIKYRNKFTCCTIQVLMR